MISFMRNRRPTPLRDQIVIGFRWLSIVVILLWIAAASSINGLISFLLLFETVVNLIWMLLLVLKRTNNPFRLISLVSDLLFAYGLFILLLPASKAIGLVGLLPLLTGIVYFSWPGFGSILISNLLIQFLIVWFLNPLKEATLLIGSFAIIYLITGFPLTFLIQNSPSGKKNQILVVNPPEPCKTDRERQKIIYKIISELSSTLKYRHVLELALDLSAGALAKLNAPMQSFVRAALLFEKDTQGNTELKVSIARNFSPVDLKIRLSGTSGILASVLDEGRPIRSKNFHKDAELKRFIALEECQSIYCYPLRADLVTFGLLLFAHDDPDFFVSDRCELLDIVGNQAVIALQNAQLFQDLEHEKERILLVQEESKKKLARDLHDGPTQSVSAIAMRVNFARRLMEKNPTAALEELFKIEDLARRTTKEIRHMLFTLRPLILESQGLVAALNSMADKMKETYSQNVIIEASADVVESLEQTKQAVVFYIAEEAVTNARKHAKAENIYVRLKMLRENLVLLEIQDDGVGFDINAVGTSYEDRGSLGMVNMRERTELVNGIFHIESEIDQGTLIRVVIPLSDDAANSIRRVG